MRSLNPSILLLGLAVATVAGCNRHDTSKPTVVDLPTATVRVQRIEAKKRFSTEDAVGTVRAKLHARLEAKLSGGILEMRAVSGQSVKAGELLVRLDAQEIRARLDQALATQQQAASDLARFRALLPRQAATQAEFDAVQARARVADAALIEAQTMLGYTEVAAPFDGVITRKLADVGDLAAPGKPLLDIEDATHLRLEADISESIIEAAKPGATMTVRVSGVSGELQGTVSEIAPSADPASRTFLVKLDLPATPGLRSGQFGRVAVPVGESVVPRVPAEAVIQRGQLEYVFVATDGRAQLRLVKTGKRHGHEVELLAGATVGEQVVLSGGTPLRDGQPLQIQP